MKDFNPNDRAEFLNEYADAILGRYDRYLLIHNIDINDTENTIARCGERVNMLKRVSYCITYENDFNALEKELDHLKMILPDEYETLPYLEDEIFEKQYRILKSRILKRLAPSKKPFATILAGQPGTGKYDTYNHYMNKITPNFASLDCDSYRKYHPRFEEIYKKYGDAERDHTKEYVTIVNKRLISELGAEKYSMIIESTLKDPDAVLSVYDQLKPLGYTVILEINSKYKELSWQRIIERNEEMKKKGVQPKVITRESYDQICDNICDSLSVIHQSGKMDDILIY
ncbi:MAG: zeta toxin family protein [Oscillospiraceae bacterium]|nr:zeta toxin family protein [Oscillospiraceae bacterium]